MSIATYMYMWTIQYSSIACHVSVNQYQFNDRLLVDFDTIISIGKYQILILVHL